MDTMCSMIKVNPLKKLVPRKIKRSGNKFYVQIFHHIQLVICLKKIQWVIETVFGWFCFWLILCNHKMHPFNYTFYALITYFRSSKYNVYMVYISIIFRIMIYRVHENESQCIMLSILKHIVKKDNSYANGEETPNFLTWGAYFMHV